MKAKQYFILIVVLFFISNTQAQNKRYVSKIFNDFITTKDIKYGVAPKTWWPYLDEVLYLDTYEPKDDTVNKRPLIIFAHASAFMFSNKEANDMQAYCDTFSRRGYVCATLNYRMGFNALDGDDALRTAYAAMQDGKAAVRFFKEYADNFRIDTNNIFFAGSSAGGIMALYAAYGDKESERPDATYEGLIAPDMGCWDCAGNAFPHSSKVKAIVSMWGAVMDTAVFDDPNGPPMLLIHGKDDKIVPYGTGHAFQAPWFPESHGSKIIEQRAKNIGISYNLKAFEIPLINHEFYGTANGYWLNLTGPNEYWDTVVTLIDDFIYQQIEPVISNFHGSTLICNQSIETYSVDATPGSSYTWEVIGGSILSDNNNEIIVQWTASGQGSVSVYETSNLFAVSDKYLVNVEITSSVKSEFYYNISDATVSFFNTSANASSYLWDFGNGDTDTSASPFYTYLYDGVYNVCLKANNSCFSESTCNEILISIPLSVSTIEANKNNKVFPNPMKSNQAFIYKHNNPNGIIRISNAIGESISTIPLKGYGNATELTISDMASGVYYLKHFIEESLFYQEKLIIIK